VHIKNNISVTTKSTRHLEQYVISKPHLKVSYIKLVQCVPEVSRLLIYNVFMYVTVTGSTIQAPSLMLLDSLGHQLLAHTALIACYLSFTEYFYLSKHSWFLISSRGI